MIVTGSRRDSRYPMVAMANSVMITGIGTVYKSAIRSCGLMSIPRGSKTRPRISASEDHVTSTPNTQPMAVKIAVSEIACRSNVARFKTDRGENGELGDALREVDIREHPAHDGDDQNDHRIHEGHNEIHRGERGTQFVHQILVRQHLDFRMVNTFIQTRRDSG